MRRGFTLIEVLVAVAIASIAGLAMLKMSSSQLFFISKLQHYSQMQDLLTIAGFHGDKSFNRSDKTLYSLIEETYTIDNDDLRDYLKSQRYRYDETVVDTLSFDTDMLSDENEDKTAQMSDLQKAADVPMIQFELIKITLSAEEKHGSILQLRMLTE